MGRLLSYTKEKREILILFIFQLFVVFFTFVFRCFLISIAGEGGMHRGRYGTDGYVIKRQFNLCLKSYHI